MCLTKMSDFNFYFKLKFFYLYLFKNLELNYLHILHIKLFKFKNYFKNSMHFTEYSLNFFNLLLQKQALSQFYFKINLLCVKNT